MSNILINVVRGIRFFAYKLSLLCHRYGGCTFENSDLYNGDLLISNMLIIFMIVAIVAEECRLLLIFLVKGQHFFNSNTIYKK